MLWEEEKVKFDLQHTDGKTPKQPVLASICVGFLDILEMTDQYILIATAKNLAENVSAPRFNVLFQPEKMPDSREKMTYVNSGDIFREQALHTMNLCFEVALEKAYAAVKESQHVSGRKARTDLARRQNTNDLRMDSVPESQEEDE